MQDFIKIHPGDNVAVALKPLSSGAVLNVDGNSVTLLEEIPQGHKFSLTDLSAGASVIKYGNAIGIAREDIKAGAWIHTHNLKTGLGDLLTYAYNKQEVTIEPTEERFFQGYRRPDGKVGVRNEIWIIPTVGCVNNIATALERMSKKYVGGTIDEVAAFPHPYGCSRWATTRSTPEPFWLI